MRYVMALLLLVGCEGLDLESSNDDPELQRPARMLNMTVTAVNDNDAPLRLYLRAGSGQEWLLDALPRGSATERLECSDGESVCWVFQIRPTGTPPDWSRNRLCQPCGSGNLHLVF